MAKKVDKTQIDMKIYKWMRGVPFEDINAKIANLRDRREVADIKQIDVAQKLGAYQSNVSALENATGPVSKKFAARYITLMSKLLNLN